MVVTSAGFVLVLTPAGTNVVDVELSMATDGSAYELVPGRLIPASEIGAAVLTVFSG